MRLDGAVESAIKLGVADVIADVVETGTTLRAAGLEIFAEPILRSEAVLVRRSDVDEPAGLDVLTRRIQGVLTAREYVLMDYDVPLDLVDAGRRDHPGPRVADGLPAAQPRLGGRARDGPPRPDQPRHGLAVRHRCPRDPRHVDPRVPALSGAAVDDAARHRSGPGSRGSVTLVAGRRRGRRRRSRSSSPMPEPRPPATRSGSRSSALLIAWFCWRQASVAAPASTTTA